MPEVGKQKDQAFLFSAPATAAIRSAPLSLPLLPATTTTRQGRPRLETDRRRFTQFPSPESPRCAHRGRKAYRYLSATECDVEGSVLEYHSSSHVGCWRAGRGSICKRAARTGAQQVSNSSKTAS